MSARTPALVTARERHCVPKILDRAILLPSRHKAFAFRTWSTFSEASSQWRYYPTAHAASTVSIVLTVPTAVGFSPKFLLGCCLTSPGKEVFTTHSHTASLNRIYLWIILPRYVHTKGCQQTSGVLRKSNAIHDSMTTLTPVITIPWFAKEVNGKSRKIVKKQKNSALISPAQFWILYLTLLHRNMISRFPAWTCQHGHSMH